MRIGIDIDGVLADFNSAFINKVIDVTGQDLFPPRPFAIPTWNYPQHYGYTHKEVSTVWDRIKADRMFWRTLGSYPGTVAVMQALRRLALNDHDIYFVTARPGLAAKTQTEDWLRAFTPSIELFPWRPTVIISSQKGQVAQALELDAYIDDRWENCEDVKMRQGGLVCLLDQPWNADAPHEEYGIVRVKTVAEFLERIDRLLIAAQVNRMPNVTNVHEPRDITASYLSQTPVPAGDWGASH